SVTDDGQPAGAQVTSVWTKTSGPGTVTFSNASVTGPSTSFSVAGVYVLRLTASDTALSAFDEVAITIVDGGNQAPVVSAGGDQTLTLPDGAGLTGTATDDGLPVGSHLTHTWSVAEAPSGASVSFSDASALATTASFSAAGVYRLHLTATDSAL